MDKGRLKRVEQQLLALLGEVRGALNSDHRRKIVRVLALLDKSQSMDKLTSDTIGGYNRFIREQREDRSTEVEVTLILFAAAEDYRVVYENQPIDTVPELTAAVYQANGHSTALNDSSYRAFSVYDLAFQGAGNYLRGEPIEADVAYLGLVITDGIENDSKTWKKADVAALMRRLEGTGRFSFVFLGSHPDSWAEARSYGYSTLNSMSYAPSSAGVKHAFASVSRGATKLRQQVNTGGALRSDALFENNTAGAAPTTTTESVPTTAEGTE